MQVCEQSKYINYYAIGAYFMSILPGVFKTNLQWCWGVWLVQIFELQYRHQEF